MKLLIASLLTLMISNPAFALGEKQARKLIAESKIVKVYLKALGKQNSETFPVRLGKTVTIKKIKSFGEGTTRWVSTLAVLEIKYSEQDEERYFKPQILAAKISSEHEGEMATALVAATVEFLPISGELYEEMKNLPLSEDFDDKQIEKMGISADE